jgi:two-component system chemotaxis response regulator CheB
VPHLTSKTGVVKGSKLIALACSTGGPKALQSVVPFIPENIDAPMLIVQHMPEGFTKSLAQRLDEMSKVHVKEAENDEILEKGVVYIAKGGSQMRVAKAGGGKYKVSLNVEPARNGLKPCADIMYESLIGSDFKEITCVVLTGMGGDGTLGIKQLNEKNQIYCIAQDAETSIVYGMPKVVYEAGLVDEVRPLTEIPDAIARNVGVY